MSTDPDPTEPTLPGSGDPRTLLMSVYNGMDARTLGGLYTPPTVAVVHEWRRWLRRACESNSTFSTEERLTIVGVAAELRPYGAVNSREHLLQHVLEGQMHRLYPIIWPVRAAMRPLQLPIPPSNTFLGFDSSYFVLCVSGPLIIAELIYTWRELRQRLINTLGSEAERTVCRMSLLEDEEWWTHYPGGPDSAERDYRHRYSEYAEWGSGCELIIYITRFQLVPALIAATAYDNPGPPVARAVPVMPMQTTHRWIELGPPES